MSKKLAIITGGQGFVGGKLATRLRGLGYEVKILSRSARGGAAKVDYNDIGALAAAMAGATAVFHLAAAIFAFNKQEFEKANIEVTANVCAAAQQAGVKNFVYLSSQAAAGPSQYKDNPKTEDDAPAPVSDYGETKLAAEAFVHALPRELHHVVLRAPVVYGGAGSGVSKIATWVRRGVMVNAGSGDTFFNFIYVEDLVTALITAAIDARANGGTFFVCEPAAYTWRYFINSMAAAMGAPKPLMFSPPRPVLELAAGVYEVFAKVFGFAPALNYDKVKEAAIKGHWVCSPAKWARLTGQRFTTLPEGLEKSFD